MPEIITIGETMIALVPGEKEPLRFVSGYSVRSAGAESNVAVGCARLGVHAAWVSSVGDDEFGIYLKRQMMADGIDCTHVISDSDHRTGVMFKELTAGETNVFYYRENSAASHMSKDNLDWEWLEKAKIVHVSGITPVLSESCKHMVLELYQKAENAGFKISFDPNIRRKLWGKNDYTELLRDLSLRSQIVLLGKGEAEVLFGSTSVDEICKALFASDSVECVAIKDGASGAYVADRTHQYFIRPHACSPVDPIGAGDGFNAGFLAGILRGCDLKTAGKMGGICGALATQVNGDTEGYPDIRKMELILQGEKEIER